MSEKYLGGIECVRALMAPAKQTINDKVVVPSSSDVQLRCNLILEETLEFLEACLGKTDDFFEYLSAIRFAADGIRNTKTEIVDIDLEEAFDAVVDIEVINLGTALTFGFPVEEGFAEVHRSNMTKVLEDGTCLLRDDGKIIKPEGYSPPDLKSILNNNQK